MADEYYVQIDPNSINTKNVRNMPIIRLSERARISAFLETEGADRGFFSNNNLDQLEGGVEQLPLLTWSFLDFLRTLDIYDKHLVELGSGNSTLYLSKVFKSVTSFETNEKWFNELHPKVSKNVKLNHISEHNLINLDYAFSKNDWLLVDFAGHRSQFIKNLFDTASTIPSQIILDNADWYRNGAEILINNGFVELPFFGFKSGQTHLSYTSLFIDSLTPLEKNDPFLPVPKNSRKLTSNGWDELV